VVHRIADRDKLIAALGEIFRERGFEGASLSVITERTGLGKGSLYHFFPGGKAEMAQVVLDEVSAWFEKHVFVPLRESADPAAGIAHMFNAVIRFFRSGRRVCLVGTFALDDTRDRFATEIRTYFSAWTEALAAALARDGFDVEAARAMAEDVVAGIQGALVLARSQQEPAVFTRAITRLHQRTRVMQRD
jgi:AcrR family transcriptional regulator